MFCFIGGISFNDTAPENPSPVRRRRSFSCKISYSHWITSSRSELNQAEEEAPDRDFSPGSNFVNDPRRAGPSSLSRVGWEFSALCKGVIALAPRRRRLDSLFPGTFLTVGTQNVDQTVNGVIKHQNDGYDRAADQRRKPYNRIVDYPIPS